MTRHFYVFTELSLVVCAGAGDSAGHDLSALGNEIFQKFRILVVNIDI